MTAIFTSGSQHSVQELIFLQPFVILCQTLFLNCTISQIIRFLMATIASFGLIVDIMQGKMTFYALYSYI